jgi:hypothetical protein
MPGNENFLSNARHRAPWNKGKLKGQAAIAAKACLVDRTRLLLEGLRRTGNLRAVQPLLGHTKIESTAGISGGRCAATAEQVEV